MDINKFAATQLAEARDDSAKSLDELSAQTGISRSTLSRIFCGQQKKIALSDYIRILRACGNREKHYLLALVREAKRQK